MELFPFDNVLEIDKTYLYIRKEFIQYIFSKLNTKNIINKSLYN